jgi:dTMP kinase
MKKFITFEGIDGSGKSTILEDVYEKLVNRGFNVIKTFEPTDTYVGKCVKECIKTNNDPYVTAFTFISDRILHVKQIKEWLDEENIVLCDRYAESTYAYQGAQLQDQMNNPIRWLKELSNDHILIPDITFLFIIDPEKAMMRIQDRNELIPFEKVSFLDKVQRNYEKLAVDDRFKIINAELSIDEITEICIDEITKKCKF